MAKKVYVVNMLGYSRNERWNEAVRNRLAQYMETGDEVSTEDYNSEGFVMTYFLSATVPYEDGTEWARDFGCGVMECEEELANNNKGTLRLGAYHEPIKVELEYPENYPGYEFYLIGTVAGSEYDETETVYSEIEDLVDYSLLP